jgi:hypothetical protein
MSTPPRPDNSEADRKSLEKSAHTGALVEGRATGSVSNRVTLKRWQDQNGFPLGRLLGANTRTCTPEEIQAWLDSRPTVLKPAITASKKTEVR